MPQMTSLFLSRRAWPMLAGMLLVAAAAPPRASAQPQPPGVSLSTRYVSGQKIS